MIAPIIDAAIGRSRAVLTILMLLLVAGTYAYMAIPKESSPDIDIPQIYISTYLEGISPEDAERLLIRPLEQELSRISGVKELKATGYQGGGFVLLEFMAGFDKKKALDDVQKAVDQVRPDLPEDVEEPNVIEVNFSLFPVLVVTLSGDLPERTLLRIAKDLQDKIETLPSVLEAAVAGNREELVEIIVDPVALESYNLNGNDILNSFARSNRLVAAGNLDTGAGRFAIEVPGLFESIYDVQDMPLRVSGDSVITVKDVAEVRRSFKDPENFARLNGERAIALEIVKRSGENIIDTINAVRQVVEAEKNLWPPGLKVSFTQDESKSIRTMLLDLQNNVISAILLVMIVTIWSLGLRSSIIVGIAIPGSFLSGILLLYMMGLTVNLVVLFSLILSVGMLVDGATIVVEYADRKMAEGLSPKDAYKVASKRMAWPVITSTLTILAAFAPLMFWPDIVGEFMKYLPLTLICVLTASLLMALIFVPVMGSIFGKVGAADDPHTLEQLSLAEHGDLNKLTGFSGFYVRILKKSLEIPGIVISATVAILIGVIILYGAIGKGVEFFPDIEPELASVLIHARGNLSIYEEDQLVREVEQRVLNVHGIETVYTRAGNAAQQGSDLAQDIIGQLQLQFMPWNQRPKADQILNEIRSLTDDIAGIYIETQKQQGGPPTGKDVQMQLASRSPEKLETMVEIILQALNEIGDFRDIEDSRALPEIKWELDIDRAQASKFGLDLVAVGNYVRMVTNGLKVSDYRPDDSDEEIDIVVRHDRDQRTLDQLDHIRIDTNAGSIPISNFITRSPQPATGTINRADQKRVITIKADLPDSINTAEKVEQIRAWINNNQDKLDPEVEITFKGEDEQQKDSQEFLANAFIVTIFLMAIVLVTQFNSFYSAFLTLTAVIMSTIGVFLGLIITGQPFGIIMSGIGVIALAGIIVSNNIVLIDTYDHLRQEFGDKMSVKETILRTGAQRLRPVMLTTITTIIGLLPIVMQLNIDFATRVVEVGAPSTQWWVQLSNAIAYGLTFSTVLTLIVTPCALMLRENLSKKGKKPFWRKAKKEKIEPVL